MRYENEQVVFTAGFRKVVLEEMPIAIITGTTPSVRHLERFKLGNVAPTNISNFLHAQSGQRIYVLGDGQSTIINGTNIFTNTAANKPLLVNAVYCFTYFSGIWYEDGQ